MVSKMKILPIVLLAVSLGLLLVVSSASHAQGAGQDGNGIINCWCDGDCRFSSIGEPVQDHSGVDKGHVMNWYLVGPTNTIVTINFADEGDCKGSPFDRPVSSGRIKNTGHSFSKIVSPPVKNDADGCFYYEISCTPSAAQQTQTKPQSTKSDPIIDVPPKN